MIGLLLMQSSKLLRPDIAILMLQKVPLWIVPLTLGYGNEEELGVALKELDMPREEFFITTKVLSNIKDPEKALKTSLEKLQLDYVDLYLIHGPFKVDLEKAWPAMEALKDQGLPCNREANPEDWQGISDCRTSGLLTLNASSKLQSTSL